MCWKLSFILNVCVLLCCHARHDITCVTLQGQTKHNYDLELQFVYEIQHYLAEPHMPYRMYSVDLFRIREHERAQIET
jgi:hypothetical protein